MYKSPVIAVNVCEGDLGAVLTILEEDNSTVLRVEPHEIYQI